MCTSSRAALERRPHAPLELVGDADRVDRPALGIGVEHDGAHQRAGEVIGHQPADDAGLADVVAHPRHVLRRRREVGGHHVARLDAVLDHLEVAHVGREDRLHLRAVDAVHDDDLVGRLAQRGEELRREHVAVARDQRDQHAVGAAELRHLRVQVGAHVLVPDRQRLVEGGVDAQAAHRQSPEQQRTQREQRQDQRAMAEDQPLERGPSTLGASAVSLACRASTGARSGRRPPAPRAPAAAPSSPTTADAGRHALARRGQPGAVGLLQQRERVPAVAAEQHHAGEPDDAPPRHRRSAPRQSSIATVPVSILPARPASSERYRLPAQTEGEQRPRPASGSTPKNEPS